MKVLVTQVGNQNLETMAMSGTKKTISFSLISQDNDIHSHSTLQTKGITQLYLTEVDLQMYTLFLTLDSYS